MDTMDPVYGSGTLLLIAAIAVAVLLVLIIVLRMHAFVALVLVSFGTADRRRRAGRRRAADRDSGLRHAPSAPSRCSSGSA